MNTILKRAAEFQHAKQLQAAGLYPFFREIHQSEGSTVEAGDSRRKMIMIGSNNYLGLTHDSRVIDAAQKAVRDLGTGCTGSRFLNGNTHLHMTLERELAEFLGKESALVMTTGFLTNYASIATLLDANDFILSDSENHASIIAGTKASLAKTIVFRHGDTRDLEEKLRELPSEPTKLVIVDGIFSMTGEIAPLREIVALKKKYANVCILVDDAHGLGVLDEKGRGSCFHLGVQHDIDFITGTFSKSFASLGGFIVGPREIMEYLRHLARGFIFSAALPPASVAAALSALQIIRDEPELRSRLFKNVQKMKLGFTEIGLEVMPSDGPILSVFVGPETDALVLTQELARNGVFATPVVFPAVPYGNALIRTSYMSSHTDQDLDEVLRVFALLATKLKIAGRRPGLHTQMAQTYSFGKTEKVLA